MDAGTRLADVAALRSGDDPALAAMERDVLENLEQDDERLEGGAREPDRTKRAAEGTGAPGNGNGRRAPGRPKQLEPADPGLLRELYVGQRLSSDTIAGRLDVSAQWVRDQLRLAGIPLRQRGGKDPSPLTREQLAELYVSQRLTLAEVGKVVGRSPSGVGKLLAAHGIPLRPRGGKRETRLVKADREVLEDLYERQRLSMPRVAERLGVHPETVARWLTEHGIAVRSRGGHLPADPEPITWELLEELHVHQGLGVAEVAERIGGSPDRVRQKLRRHGIAVRPDPRRGSQEQPALPREVLVELYVDEGLNVVQVAERLSVSAGRVRRDMERHGVALRTKGERRLPGLEPLTAQLLTELYVRQRLSTLAIARQLGGTPDRVRLALLRHGIPLRSPAPPGKLALTTEELARLYVDERVPAEDIADRLGVATYRVRQALRAAGVRRPSRPPHRPPPPAPPREVLEDLYLAQGLPVAVIAQRYRTATPKARRWLVDAGIEVAERTSRAHRRVLPRDVLERLYVAEGRTAEQVADELGETVKRVLRSLHAYAIPVRLGGAQPADGAQQAVELLADLYADAEVTAALDAHGVPRRPRAGSIAERFPEPIRLTPALLQVLYVGIGLSSHHVELLTGQPAEQVLDALHAHGIPVRPLTNSSPWYRRLAAAHRRSGRRRGRPNPS